MTVTAKDIVLKQIDSHTANALVRKLHYSGKVAQNSQIHIGVFLNGILHGAMQFGPSLDKRKIQGLVTGTAWHEFLELNRMAFDEALPRNSESRALGVAMRLLRKYAPQVKWVISFADGTQCGDGTIYRAAGFVLTGFSKGSIFANDKGEKYQQATISARGSIANMEALGLQYRNGGGLVEAFRKAHNLERLEGYSIRYIYFLDPVYRARLTVPELPYSEIERRGAKMYKGQRPGGEGETDSAAGSNLQTEGASPISPLSKVESNGGGNA